jgi:hypothetical protein
VIDETDVLAPLASKQYGRTIDFGQPGNDQLRVTLVWTDIQGTTSASQHRINNLDLKVTSPLGSVFWGNNGLMEGNWSAAGGSPNTLDTTENVFIQNPIGGNWNIEVIAAEINQDGHVETPEVDADYALVISGGVDCPGPQFAAQPPATMYECYGNDVTLSATVTDYNSLQWYHDGTPISGETGPTLDITGLSPADEGEYWLEATNDCVTYRTDGTMLLDPGTPTVTQQPTQPTPRCEGEDTYLTVAAGGVGPFTYQWYHDGVPAPSATSATLSLLPAQASDAGDWFCEISNACNSVDSDTVTLVINPLPSFLVQPADTCASVGDTVVLTTDVTPDAGVYIQWRKESSSDTFGTSETLTLNNVQAADADDYYVVAFTLNPTCIAESDRATLTVATGLTCSSTMGDLDGDGDYDLYDMSKFMQCYGTDVSGDFCCACANLEDSDTIIDNADWAAMESLTTGPQ